MNQDLILERKASPLSCWHAFIIGVFLGHPLNPAAGVGVETGGMSLFSRLTAVDFFICTMLIGFLLSYRGRGLEFSWGGRELRWPRYTWAFLAFWLSCIVSVLFSPYFSTGWHIGAAEILIYFYLFVFSVVLYNLLLDEKVFSMAVWGVIVGVLTSIAMAYSIKFLDFPPVHQHSNHLQGTFRNGAQFGAYLFYVALMVFPLYLFKARDLQKKLILIVLILVPFAIFISSKRSAIASLVVLVAIVLFYVVVVSHRKKQAVFILAMIALAYFIFAHFVFPRIEPEEQEYFVSRAKVLMPTAARKEAAGYRGEFEEDNWKTTVSFFDRNPITGIGISMGVAGPTGLEIHNSYLRFIGEGGILMLIGGIWLLLAMGFYGPHTGRGLLRQQLNLINCYRYAYIAVMVINLWAWGIRRREVWFVVAFIEAVKAISGGRGNMRR
jgi:hypothetical protein